MGYMRPVSHYNQGKKAEFYSRKYFSERGMDIAMANNEFIDNNVLANNTIN